MRHLTVPALAALLLAFALGGCAATRPTTLAEARSFCNTAGGGISAGASDSGSMGGSCMDQLRICSRFFDPLAAGAADRAACLAQCGAANAELFHTHAMDDCRPGLTRANDLCEEYCRSNFK